MKKKTTLFVLLVLLLTFPATVWSSAFNTLVVFGDSLSDNGNLYAMDPSKAPAALYYEGRFSNGRVWVEYLAGKQFLDCTLVDKAYAGARTDGVSPPGLISQVNAHVAAAPLEKKTLFAIWIGANDFLGGGVDYQAGAANIATALNTLADHGAEHILIVNLPDLGATPRYIGTAEETAARALSQNFNQALAGVVAAFEADNPRISVYAFNSHAFLQAVANDPAGHGFTNATAICPSYQIPGNFDNSAGYVFWDAVHPTTEAHLALAEQAFTLLPDDEDKKSSGGGGCFIRGLLSN